MNQRPRAVILLSGGLDSATVAAIAGAEGFELYALTVNYGQRHAAELNAAERVAKLNRVAAHRVVDIDLRQFGGSSLTSDDLDVPTEGESGESSIPSTYVPARNTIMLSVALAWAETLGAHDIFCGVNAVDYSGYPDCRPDFIRSFEHTARLATRAGVEGERLDIHAPLIRMRKADIIQCGLKLGVDYAQTVSCYQADQDGRACGVCDSCRLRRDGFRHAGVDDPTLYQEMA